MITICLPKFLWQHKNHKIAFSYVTRGIVLKNIHTRVMVLMHNMSSECMKFVEISLTDIKL